MPDISKAKIKGIEYDIKDEKAREYGETSGLSSTAKTLLITILRNGLYSTDQSGNITSLEAALATSEPDVDVVTYTITNNLTNVSTSNVSQAAVSGSTYSATLTADNGYKISSVVITMGGTDVTDSVYSDGIIAINNITGDIVITATVIEDASELVVVLAPTYTAGVGWPNIGEDGAWVDTSGTYVKIALGEYYGGLLTMEWDTADLSAFEFSVRCSNADGVATYTSSKGLDMSSGGNVDDKITWVTAGSSATTLAAYTGTVVLTIPDGSKAAIYARRGSSTGNAVTSNTEFATWVTGGGITFTLKGGASA